MKILCFQIKKKNFLWASTLISVDLQRQPQISMWNSLLSWKQSLKLHFIYEQLRKKLLEQIEWLILTPFLGSPQLARAIGYPHGFLCLNGCLQTHPQVYFHLKQRESSSKDPSVNWLFCRTSVFSIKTNHSAGDLFLGLWCVPQCLAYRRCSVNARWLLFLLLFIHSAQSPLLSMP